MSTTLRTTAIALALLGTIGLATAQSLTLSADQKAAIYAAVEPEKANVQEQAGLTASVGASVPANIQLHALPEDAIAAAPGVEKYRFTIAQNQVLLVDPTSMKVVEVIKQ